MSTVTGLRASAVAVAFLVVVASCGGASQVSPPEPSGEAPPAEAPPPASVAAPPGVAFEPSSPQVSSPSGSSTRPSVASSTGSSAPGRGESPASTVSGAASTVPGGVEPSSTLPSGASTTLPAFSGGGVSVWSTEELAGFFEARVDSFRFLGGPEYDASTPLGAFCWVRWEIARAYAFEAILGGEPPYDELPFDEEGDGGTAFKVLREELVHRARRGDDKASRTLLDAAGVRTPGEDHSVASTVDAVDAPGVRETALSAGEVELRSAAEALFAWVDEYKRASVSEASALEEDFIYSVGPTRSCEHPTPPGMENTLTIEDLRALTLEEVENLTPEQLRDIDIETITNGGLLLRDFPLDLQYAWAEKSLMQTIDYLKALCCYAMITEDLVESLASSEDTEGDDGGGLPSVLETLEEFNRNENDPSTPVGAFCWAYWETDRSFGLYQHGYVSEAMFYLLRDELLARAEMGDAVAADALKGIPAEVPPREYPFGEALAAADDPQVRGTAFEAEDPVLLEVVGVFYALVDEYRQEEAPSPYAFTAEFSAYISPGSYQQPGAEERALEPGSQTRQSLFEECNESW